MPTSLQRRYGDKCFPFRTHRKCPVAVKGRTGTNCASAHLRRSFALFSWLTIVLREHLICSTASSSTLFQNPESPSLSIQSSQSARAVSQSLNVLSCKTLDSKAWSSALFAIEKLTVDLFCPVHPSIRRIVSTSRSLKEGLLRARCRKRVLVSTECARLQPRTLRVAKKGNCEALKSRSWL